MTNSTSKKHLDFVDLLKAIAIFFVLIYHFPLLELSFLESDKPIYYFNYFLKSILSTCVPIFFFVNGGLLLNKSRSNVKNHVKKIFKIFIILLFWAAVTVCCLSIIRNQHVSIIEGITMLASLEENWVNHLWFLESLIIVYIFYPLIHLAYKNSKQIFYFFLIAVLIFSFFNKLIGTIATVANLSLNIFPGKDLMSVNYFKSLNPFLGINGLCLGYFMLGGLFFSLSNRLNTIKIKYLALLILTISMLLLTLFGVKLSLNNNVLWDHVWNGYDTIFTVINVIALFVLFLKYKKLGFIGNLVKNISSNTLGIYLIHIIIGYALKPYFSYNGFFSTLLFAFALLLISNLVVNILKRIPILKRSVAL